MSDYFPQEIILHILHKLPIKSLVRCTSVCKTWHSLITNPSFISTHLTLTISSNTTTDTHLLLFRLYFGVPEDYSEHCSLRFGNQRLAPSMHFHFPSKPEDPFFRIIDSLNGIICLVDDSSLYTNTFILWNPLIKKSVTLPGPNVTFFPPGLYILFTGFGFDSKTNDYKLLRFVYLLDCEDAVEVELYSLNTNSWKSLTSSAPKYEFNEGDMQAFVNGVLHWVAFKGMRNGGFRNLVLGFNMGDEVFHEI